MKRLLLTFIFLVFTFLTEAHPIKMSTGKLYYDQSTQHLRLTINFFLDDFSDHLKKLYRRPYIQFDQDVQIAKEMVDSYVNSKFYLKVNNEKMSLFLEKLVVLEDNVIQAQFSIGNAKGLRIQAIEVHNELLFDAFKDQVNIVRIDLHNNNKDVNIMRFFPGGATISMKSKFLCD